MTECKNANHTKHIDGSRFQSLRCKLKPVALPSSFLLTHQAHRSQIAALSPLAHSSDPVDFGLKRLIFSIFVCVVCAFWIFVALHSAYPISMVHISWVSRPSSTHYLHTWHTSSFTSYSHPKINCKFEQKGSMRLRYSGIRFIYDKSNLKYWRAFAVKNKIGFGAVDSLEQHYFIPGQYLCNV